MTNMRAVRTRIKSVESTRQITKSMKMVAASKLRHIQGFQKTYAEFETGIDTMLSAALSDGRNVKSPYLEANEKQQRCCYVLFVGNRGLCGMYNTGILKYLRGLLENEKREYSVIVCGSWGSESLAASGLPVIKQFDDIGDTPSFEDAAPLTDFLRELWLSGEYSEIKLVYQHFKTVLSQIPGEKRLLPLKIEAADGSNSDCIFEPDRDTLIRSLIERCLEGRIYSALLEAKTGEHAARMTAMTAAADNTDELIKKLNLELNHARQAAITTELAEIVGGSAAIGD